jgi:hypothetical protein
VPKGDLRPAVLADLKPHRSGSKTYNEFWTYHILLDGNIQAYLNFSRVNLGSFKAPPSTNCRCTRTSGFPAGCPNRTGSSSRPGNGT